MKHPPSIDSQTRRLLRKLSAPGAFLTRPDRAEADAGPQARTAPPVVASGVPYQLMSRAGTVCDIQIAGSVVAEAAERGWVIEGEGRFTLTTAGAASLRRALAMGDAAGPASRTVRAKPGSGKSDTQGLSPARPTAREGRREPTSEAAGFNEAESPLGWLRRRKDKNGAVLISDEQFTAGERLRADVLFAGMSPRITMDWGRSGGDAAGRRSAPGGSAQMLDTMVAARQRIDRAMRAVGPEMSGLLLDVCGFMKGLESIEMERGWPPRSGKVVLLHALSMLARHYGLLKAPERAEGPAGPYSGRTRHWGSDGYRPGLADGETSQVQAAVTHKAVRPPDRRRAH